MSLAEQRIAQAQPAPPRPQQPRAARTERPNPPPRQRPQALAPGDVERYPLLAESLRQVLPADAKIETELARFRRVQDLALAVAISRDFDIPFTTLSRTLEGPPRLAPRGALGSCVAIWMRAPSSESRPPKPGSSRAKAGRPCAINGTPRKDTRPH